MNATKLLSFLLLSFFIPFLSFGQDDQIKIPNRKNADSQLEKPYVILISIDGFRYDYFDRYQPEFFLKMRKKGVAAQAMIPSFPSVTFPNHYTLVTGLIPPHHGIIGNTMYDPSTQEWYSIRNAKAVKNPDWYGGMPIWSLAESQNLLTACYYWPGSEAPIAGYYPSYYYPYSETTGVAKRIEEVVKWLKLPEARRPHLITFYMPQVDHAGHTFGPESMETESAVYFVDAAIKQLDKEVRKTGLPVNFIVVSDHGMIGLNTAHPLSLPKVKPNLVEEIVNNGTYASVFVKKKEEVKKVYKAIRKGAPQEYKVYLKTEVPKKYHFSDQEDTFNREGDIVLIAEAPYYFSKNGTIPKGSHGYLPEDTPEMKTVFTAWGPNIKKHKKINAFKNIQVYPLLANLLGLEYDTDNIDGDEHLARQVLR